MADPLAPDRIDVDRRIKRERLRLVYEQIPRSIPLTIAAVTVMAVLGALSLPAWAVSLWWFGMVGLVLLRYATVQQFRRSELDPADHRD